MQGWIWPTIGLFIYLADGFVRFIKRNANDVVVHNIQKCPGKAVFLRLGLNKSTMHMRPGQYILLQCLNISSLEWHPFTVTKVSNLFLKEKPNIIQCRRFCRCLRERITPSPYSLQLVVTGPWNYTEKFLRICASKRIKQSARHITFGRN